MVTCVDERDPVNQCVQTTSIAALTEVSVICAATRLSPSSSIHHLYSESDSGGLSCPKRCILCSLSDGVQVHQAHVRYEAVDALMELRGSGHYSIDPIDNVSAWTIDQSMRKGRVPAQCGLVFAVSTLILSQQPCVSRITCNTNHLQHAAPHTRSVCPRSRQVPAFCWLVFLVGQAQSGSCYRCPGNILD